MNEETFRHFPDLAARRTLVKKILAKHSAPVFLVDKSILADRFGEIKNSLQEYWGNHIIGYSFKTNYMIAESGVLQSHGAWAEVVSGREYDLAKKLGYEGKEIIFNGPCKTDDDLRRALAERAILNINDHDELNRVINITALRKGRYEIGIRLSGNLPQFGHSRFGFSMENDEAESAVRKIQEGKNLTLTGCHMHIHGDTDDTECFRAAIRKVNSFISECIQKHEQTIRFIDMGGGFPANSPKPYSRSRWNPLPIRAYIQTITSELTSVFPQKGGNATLIVEPGRYLVADAAVFVSRVIGHKTSDNRQLVTSNGSIAMIPLTHYCPQIIRAFNSRFSERQNKTVPTTIYGSTCRENDVLYQGHFPRVAIGDYLVHYASGAYNSNLDPGFIFDRPRLELM